MRHYFTGLLLQRDESHLNPCAGCGWTAYTAPARSVIRKGFSKPVREIVIQSANAKTAQKALNLIKTSHELLDGPDTFGGRFRVIPQDRAEFQRLFPDPIFDQWATVQMAGFPEACRLASRASRKRAFTYAISLFHVSQMLHVNHPMDLHFGLCSADIRSVEPHDQVRFAYSILTAYAVIEQLGLALHGEAFQNGKWIPTKRVDLEARLIANSVDLAKPVLWRLRGGRTMLEKRRKTQALNKAKWARRWVRDEEVDLVDAIADLRWLRSRVAAHDVKDLARLLSVFDVANAQHLARRCILACLGHERTKQ